MPNYVKTYELFRFFLRFFSVGCYHKNYITKITGQSARSYEDYWSRVKFFLPEDRQLEHSHDNLRHHTLKGDYFYGAANYLSETYNAMTITPKKLCSVITILQVLGNSTKPLSVDELWGKIYEILDTSTPLNDISITTVNSYVNFLHAQGVLSAISINKKTKLYTISPNIFKGLSFDELSCLITALSLYKNIALLQITGYQLQSTLSRFCQKTFPNYPLPNSDLFFQLKNIKFTRILDDNIRKEILHCIENGYAAKFYYNGKEREALPEYIITDYYTGHQYMMGYIRKRKSSNTFTVQNLFRLENISDISPTTPAELPESDEANYKQIEILFTYFAKDEKEVLLHKILACRNYAKNIVAAEEADNMIRCKMDIVDQLRLVPWLTSFLPNVKVITNGSLKHRIEDNIRLSMLHYSGAKDNIDLLTKKTPSSKHFIKMNTNFVKSNIKTKAKLAALSPMNELHSGLFTTLSMLINRIYSGEKLSYEYICKSLNKENGQDAAEFENYITGIFYFTPDNIAHLKTNLIVPFTFSLEELRYLKTMLTDDKMSFLLPDSLRNKLLPQLKSVITYPFLLKEKVLRHQKSEKSIPKKNIILEAFMQGLKNKQLINIDYNEGCIDCIPLRIEYDGMYDKINLIVSDEENNILWLALENIYSIKLLPKHNYLDVTEIFNTFLCQHNQTVTLQLYPFYNGVDRCFTLFSSYNKQSAYNEEEERYTMTVEYKEQEETDIIEKILNLGPAVKVVEPIHLQQKIINILSQAVENINI